MIKEEKEMEQKSLARWLKFIIIGVAICGALIYFCIIPECGRTMVNAYPEFSFRYWPWLIFLWITAIPCYGVLIFGWQIATNIGKDKSFSMGNAKALKWISWLAIVDTIFFFVINVVYLFLDLSHPGVVLLSLIVVFAGVAVSVAAAALSHLVQKAAVLQEQSDLTI